MSKLREFARGRDCTLRLIPHCNGNPETTILAHLPSPAKGMGLKSPDVCSCLACSSCHDVIDGRQRTDYTRADLAESMLRAHFETLLAMIREGLISVKGEK